MNTQTERPLEEQYMDALALAIPVLGRAVASDPDARAALLRACELLDADPDDWAANA